MAHNGNGEDRNKKGPIAFLVENSIFLVAGAVSALVWANLHHESYERFVNFDLRRVISDQPEGEHEEYRQHEEHSTSETDHAESAEKQRVEEATGGDEGHGDGGGHHGLTIHFVINDILMAFFFAIAGKEVWESLLPGGALSNPRKAATPLLATLGGIVGPAGLYLLGVFIFLSTGTVDSAAASDLSRGWAIPCATDIAFSYLVARIIFGAGHPAIAFLLLLAIADDAAGLVILAIAYPQSELQPIWFLLTGAAVAVGFALQKRRVHGFWWYLLIPGTMSWFSFYMAGIHAALGLVPIIPCMPHAHTDLGIFAREQLNRHDTLNEFEHWWETPVELILGLFGLVNAGVQFSSVGAGTVLVLTGLIVGKPLGITLLTWFSEKVLKLEVPAGMTYRHIFTLGVIAGIGFTVALFVSEAAFPAGAFSAELRGAVKMGALASFFAGALALVVAFLLDIRPLKNGGEETSAAGHDEEPSLSTKPEGG
jgi:NhaA family Na+:H+ antiporter